MVIDVAEAAQLGASQNADPLRAKQRALTASAKRKPRATRQRVDGGTRSEGKKKLTRKRQRDEEILEKKKAYRAEIEASAPKQRATAARR